MAQQRTRKNKRWTDQDNQFLRDNHQAMSAASLSAALGRKTQHVSAQLFRLRLVKRPKKIATVAASCRKKPPATDTLPIVPAPEVIPGKIITQVEKISSEIMDRVEMRKREVGTYNHPIYNCGQVES